MPVIHSTTFVAAPAERVFDLSRSIELHRHSMRKHKEKVIGDLVYGLVREGGEVTWKARHLFKTRILKTKITQYSRPTGFIDEQITGDFQMMQHQHFFKRCDNGTIMIDIFQFECPYNLLGKIFSKIYLTGYVKGLLEVRNKLIKETAEGSRWKNYLT